MKVVFSTSFFQKAKARSLSPRHLICRKAEHPGLLCEENGIWQDFLGHWPHATLTTGQKLIVFLLAKTEADKHWISLVDGLKELEKYLLYIVAVTKSFGGPVSL